MEETQNGWPVMMAYLKSIKFKVKFVNLSNMLLHFAPRSKSEGSIRGTNASF